jgi:hypothetical protein
VATIDFKPAGTARTTALQLVRAAAIYRNPEILYELADQAAPVSGSFGSAAPVRSLQQQSFIRTPVLAAPHNP